MENEEPKRSSAEESRVGGARLLEFIYGIYLVHIEGVGRGVARIAGCVSDPRLQLAVYFSDFLTYVGAQIYFYEMFAVWLGTTQFG